MAFAEEFVERPLPGVNPRWAAAWNKYRRKTREAVEQDNFEQAVLSSTTAARYRAGLSKFWGVAAGPIATGNWMKAAPEAVLNWNAEFNTTSWRSYNATKWLVAARAGATR